MAQLLNIKRYLQDTSHCAVGAASTVANFHNKNVTYELAKEITYKEVTKRRPREPGNFPGLEDSETGMLLNLLGFRSVTMVSTNLNHLDYSWSKLSKKELLKEMQKNSGNKLLYQFLSKKDFRNKLKIDYKYGEHIRNAIDKGLPVIIGFNWTMMFKTQKEGKNHKPDPVRGDYEWHCAVVRGYSDKGAYIVDSSHEYYKYRLARYRKGKYVIPWEDLMVCLGMDGSLHIPSNYDESLLQYELV